MNIILTENVDGLGSIGDIVKVKPGYARNFLIPRKFAMLAHERNLKELEHQKRQLERKAIKVAQTADALKKRLEELRISFVQKAGEEGKLFGAVTARDIASAIEEAGVEFDRKKIQLDEPIKTVGDFKVAIKLDAGYVAEVSVSVAAEEE